MEEHLERELQKVLAEREIRRQLFAYHEAMNRADFDALIPLLGDAVMTTWDAPMHRAGVEPPPPEQQAGTIQGGAQLAKGAAAAWITYDGNPRIQFCATNVVVEVADSLETATCHAYFLMFQGLGLDEFPLQLVSSGRYFDTYRQAEGRWQLVERQMYADLGGDQSKHIRSDWSMDFYDRG
jgi:hypothetical protein